MVQYGPRPAKDLERFLELLMQAKQLSIIKDGVGKISIFFFNRDRTKDDTVNRLNISIGFKVIDR